MQKYEKMSIVRAYEINKTLIPKHFWSLASQDKLSRKLSQYVGVFLLKMVNVFKSYHMIDKLIYKFIMRETNRY